LLENFDAEVHDKLRVNLEKSKDYLNKHEQILHKITYYLLGDDAVFEADSSDFELKHNPFVGQDNGAGILLGKYRMGVPDNKPIEDADIYRPRHPLAQCVIDSVCALNLPVASLTFDYTNHPQNAVSIVGLVGKSRWLSLNKLTINSAETEDYLILSAVSDDGAPVLQEKMELVFSLPATAGDGARHADEDVDTLLKQKYEESKASIIDEISSSNAAFFDGEMTKLDAWADDLKEMIRQSIKDFDKEIRQVRRDAKLASTLEEKLGLQKR